MLVTVYFYYADRADAAMRVMIVDDDFAIRQLVGIALLNAGHDVIYAEDGEQALILIQPSQPDLIIADVMMPGMSGIELCQRVRGDAKTAHISVLLLSAISDAATIQAGVQAGANAYLTKPLVTSRLIAEISALASQ